MTAKGGNRQLRIKERAKVETVLLRHEASRQAFLDQTKVHLRQDTHAYPSRGVIIFYEDNDTTPISAEIICYRLGKQGLGELAGALKYIDLESFDNAMVVDCVGKDSPEALQKLFQWKYIEEPSEDMVKRALGNSAAALEYPINRFGQDIVIAK